MINTPLTHALVEAMPLAAVLIDETGRIGAMNDPARRLLGPGLEALTYQAALRQPGLAGAVEESLSSGAARMVDLVTPAGDRDVSYDVHCVPVSDGGKIGVLISFEDRSASDAAGAMRRDFVANVSHELRTPLTALLGFAETLQGQARDDAEARERFLKIMVVEAERMNRLVNDLLSLSRVEADERVAPKDRVDLAAVVGQAAQSLETVAEAAEVEIALDGADQDLPVNGDADQLQQVFTNLIENAVKYGGSGKTVTLALTRIGRDATLQAEACRVDVIDLGEGIDPLHLPRLTERFYRVDSHRSRQMGGTGLGLAIVKHIVNRHRGRLAISSQPGEGSRFSVVLPVASV